MINGQEYRYTFANGIDMTEAEATLTLARLATESLHGESRVRLETRHEFDAKARSCVIDASTEVGRDFNQLFLGFVVREFGSDSFRVQRSEPADDQLAPTAA